MAKGITLQELDASALVNLVPHLGTTSNSGDAFSITTSATIGVNQKFTIKFNAASSSAPTLKINNGTVYPIKKANGNNAKIYPSVYSLFWDGSNFTLLGEGGEYGTAGSGDVRSTKTIGAETGIVQGALQTRATGATTVIPGPTAQTLAAGIYDGDVTVSAITPLFAAGSFSVPANSTVTIPKSAISNPLGVWVQDFSNPTVFDGSAIKDSQSTIQSAKSGSSYNSYFFGLSGMSFTFTSYIANESSHKYRMVGV